MVSLILFTEILMRNASRLALEDVLYTGNSVTYTLEPWDYTGFHTTHTGARAASLSPLSKYYNIDFRGLQK